MLLLRELLFAKDVDVVCHQECRSKGDFAPRLGAQNNSQIIADGSVLMMHSIIYRSLT